MSGTSAISVSDSRNTMRESVPCDRIAATCSPMMNSRGDHGGDDLRDEPRALRADQTEQPDRDGDRERRGCRAERDHDAIGAEPARSAAQHQHVDQRRGKQHRHQDHGERHRGDAHREQLPYRDRRDRISSKSERA